MRLAQLLLGALLLSCTDGEAVRSAEFRANRRAEVNVGMEVIKSATAEFKSGKRTQEELEELISSFLKMNPNFLFGRFESGGFVLGVLGPDGLSNTEDDYFLISL